MLQKQPKTYFDSFQIQQIADQLMKNTLNKNEQCHDKLDEKLKQIENKIVTESSINTYNKKLYQLHRYFKNNQEKRLDVLQKQLDGCQDFKVKNSISKRINKQNPSKPLFQRSQEIINSRQKKNTERKIRQDAYNLGLQIGKSNKKIKINECNQFHEKQKQFQKKRSSFLNLRRAQVIGQQFNQLKNKPQLNPQSKNIIKHLGYTNDNLFDRFQLHKIKRERQITMTAKRIYQTQTPFSPTISPNSKLLANKSFKNLNKSASVFQRMKQSSQHKHRLKKQDDKCTTHHQSNKTQHKFHQKSHQNVKNNFYKPFQSPLKSQKDLSPNKRKNISERINLYNKQICNQDDDQKYEVQNPLNGNKQLVVKLVKN